MRIELPEKLQLEVQAYADENGFSFEEACLQLVKLGLAIHRSEQTSKKIPPSFRA